MCGLRLRQPLAIVSRDDRTPQLQAEWENSGAAIGCPRCLGGRLCNFMQFFFTSVNIIEDYQ
ncbi:hypothetical protein [Trichothermofontia sp.]